MDEWELGAISIAGRYDYDSDINTLNVIITWYYLQICMTCGMVHLLELQLSFWLLGKAVNNNNFPNLSHNNKLAVIRYDYVTTH